ncbi:MAG: hypothetical protein IPN70_00650 [Candidatus Moraniibacteriota bacterium]|nr:MAG: hypothetical protein IPN70_00650 [Candidatus Moranbacteria bacterium]
MKNFGEKKETPGFDDVIDIPLEIFPSKPKNLKKGKKKNNIILFFIILFLFLGIFFVFFRPFLIEKFSHDDELVDDSDVRWRKIEISKEENAYYQLLELEESFSLTTEEKDVIKKMIKGAVVEESFIKELSIKYEHALNLFSQASEKLKYQNPRFFNPDSITMEDFDFSSLAVAWEYVAQLQTLRAFVLMQEKKYDEAIEETMKSIRIAQLIEESQCTTIEYLSARAMKEVGMNAARKIFILAGPVDIEWEQYLEEIHRYSRNEIAIISAFKSEYHGQALAIATLSEGNPGMISSIFQKEAEYQEDFSEKLKNTYHFKPNKTRNIFAQNTRIFIREVDALCVESNFFDKSKSPAEQIQLYFEENSIGKKLVYTYGIDPFDLMEKRCEEDVFVGASEITLALKYFYHQKGYYPETLKELVPQYLPEISKDPFDGNDLKYNKERKILYSVGYDGADSKGEGFEGDWNSPDIIFSVNW